MSTITVSRTLDAPVSKVWATLTDFGGIYRYSAAIESSPINPGTPETGVGAERTCKLYDGHHIQERITGLHPERQLDIVIFDTSMPLVGADIRFELAPTATGGCQLSMTMAYQLKYGPVGWLMDQLMMKKGMTGSLERLLAALDEHLRTGALIEQGWKATG